MKSWIRTVTFVIGACGFFSVQGYASEISYVQGLYKSENNKEDGKKTVGSSEISAGARYSEPYSDNLHWFGQAMLALKSFSGDNAPDNSTDLMLRGGMRMYFNQFSETILPFGEASAGYKSEKTIDATNEYDKNGIYYWGNIGLRMEVGQGFFFELSTDLFESALWATEKTKPLGKKNADTEKDRMELYFDTTGAFDTTYVAAGMKF